MIAALVPAVAVYGAGLALLSLVGEVLRRPPGPRLKAGAVVLQVGLMLLVGLRLLSLLGGGHRPPDVAVAAGYAVAAVAVVPLAVALPGPAGIEGEGLGLALAAAGVVVHGGGAALQRGVAVNHAAAGRLLVALYSVLALAAGARALVQLATRFDAAPVAYLLSLAAALVYLAIAVGLRVPGPRARRMVWIACAAELGGVLAVGAFTALAPNALGDQSVWTDFGAGYGFVPLVLPAAALWWLGRERQPVVGTPLVREGGPGVRGTE